MAQLGSDIEHMSDIRTVRRYESPHGVSSAAAAHAEGDCARCRRPSI